MVTNYIEVKVRYFDDYRKWEEIDVLALFPDIKSVTLASWNRDIKEIRWTHPGSTQGHYFFNPNHIK